jgi:hypothetical protein
MLLQLNLEVVMVITEKVQEAKVVMETEMVEMEMETQTTKIITEIRTKSAFQLIKSIQPKVL